MQTRSDDLIRSDVLFELKWDPKIGSSSDIAVAVKDGVVTLSGFVHSYWDKDAAEEAAKRVYGVRGVANEIEVKPSSTRTERGEPLHRCASRPLRRRADLPDLAFDGLRVLLSRTHAKSVTHHAATPTAGRAGDSQTGAALDGCWKAA